MTTQTPTGDRALLMDACIELGITKAAADAIAPALFGLLTQDEVDTVTEQARGRLSDRLRYYADIIAPINPTLAELLRGVAQDTANQ